MKNLDVDGPLKILELNNDVIIKLEKINIKTIKELWLLKRKELKDRNFNDSEINHIRIKMQLWGIDLNKKTYL